MYTNVPCTTEGCEQSDGLLHGSVSERPWHETEAMAGFRVWHVIFFSFAAFLAIVIVICCCVRIRIPRTKQEIEADYIRKKITRKFQRQLRLIHNVDMDEMDLKRALDRIRAEFKSDTESLAQSEALSGATLSSGNFNGPANECGSYRKASDIGVTFDQLLERQQKQDGFQFPTMNSLLSMFRSPRVAQVME